MNTAAAVSGGARATAPEVQDFAVAAGGTGAAGGAGGARAAGAAKAGGAKAAAAAARAKSTAAPAAAKKQAAKAAAKTTVKAPQVSAAKTGYATSSAAATGEYAFLKDPNLSLEEKLLYFLALQKKNTNAEIQKLLDKAAEQKEQAAKKKSGGGLLGGVTKVFDVAKSVVPALGLADKLLGGKLDDLLKQVSGPLLASAATAVGLPMLAPLALKAGPALAGAVLDAKVGGSSGATSASGSSSSSVKSEPGKLDEVDTARIQVLQKRMEEWTTLLSNLMNSFHQTRMSVIHNLR